MALHLTSAPAAQPAQPATRRRAIDLGYVARPQFEALLLEIAEYAEEWLTSAQAMGLAERRPDARVLPWDRSVPNPKRNGQRPPVTSGPRRDREDEW